MTHFCSFFTLGQFRIAAEPDPEADRLPRKSRALLVFLAYEGRAQPRETLAELLWGDQEQTHAAGSLRMALTSLRVGFDSYLQISRHQVELQNVWMDAAALRSSIESLRPDFGRLTPEQAEQISQAAALYQGEFLPGFYVPGAPGFENWLQQTRIDLHRSATDGLAALTKWQLEHGSATSGLQTVQRLLHLDPLREDAHRLAMRLYAALGERGAALKQFDSCQALLRSEMGVEPDAETIALADSLRRNDPNPPSTTPPPAAPPQAAPPEPPRQGAKLPTPATPFVGREPELHQLATLIADPTCRLLTVVGAGGIGKTRLVLEAAAKQIDVFPDGVYFAPLAPVTHADLLLQTLAGVFNAPIQAQVDLQLQLLHFLESRRLLLVLDNFEHLLDATDLLVELLDAAPGLHLLITSREPLRVQQEWLIRLEGMPVPAQNEAALEGCASAELFMQSARRTRPDLVVRDPAAVVTICRALDGLPLALELAASWLRALSLAEVAEEVTTGLDFLTASVRNLPERHRSLRLVFEGSWGPLSPAERTALARLSVFRGSFTLEGARAVAGTSLSVLAALVEKSLVRSMDGRYDLHELLRQFAAEKLDEIGGETDARHAHLRYYTELAVQSEPKVYSGDIRMRDLRRENDNLRAALSWSIDHAPLDGLHLAGHLFWFWQTSGVYALEGFNWLTTMIERAGEPFLSVTWAKGMFSAAGVAWWQHDFKRARMWIDASVAMWEQLNDPTGLGFALMGRGMTLTSFGELQEARTAYEQSIALFRQVNNRWGLTLSVNGLGEVGLAMGTPDIHEQFWQEVVQFARNSQLEWFITAPALSSVLSRHQGYSVKGDPGLTVSSGNSFLATSLCNLAKAMLRQGQHLQAADLYRESLQLFQQEKHEPGIATCLEGVAALAAAVGLSENAVLMFAAAESLRQQLKITLTPDEQSNHDRLLAEVRETMSADAFQTAWTRGSGVSIEAAVSFALEELLV